MAACRHHSLRFPHHGIVAEVRDYLFAEGDQEARPGLARRPSLSPRERSELARNRAALLRQRMAQTALAVRFAAADTATLLGQQAKLFEQPGRIDYPTEIKRWQALADQAGLIAERWEQRS